ncbi:MAG: alkaline phosphatase family protein [Deltaproteobacteria bacterium]|nr:alkaline phosphatase family protein [Deltaproteobacteria bacterium]
MILADGAREDLFRRLLEEGKLPHIQKEIVGRGAYAKGVTVFPSTTGPAYFPFLTGYHPGDLNVPGIRWFDKSAYANAAKKMVKFRSYVGIETFLINSDIKPVPTVFDLLPQSFSIFNSVCRGAGRRNLTKIMRIWYWYYAHLTDRWEFLDQQALAKTLRAIEKDFRFLFVVFPGIDEYAHLAHPHHEKTIERYRFLDDAVGELAAKLKAKGELDDTLFWIVSDHGLSATHTHFCVNEFMEKRGLPPFYYPKVFHRRGKKVANMMSGNGMTHLYFKNGHDWGMQTTRTDIRKIDSALLADLVKEPAVDILAVRNGDGGIDILSKRGEAKLKLLGDKVEYSPSPLVGEGWGEGGDPFGYSNLSGTLTKEEILEKTIDTDYPDALWQLAQIFKASRTGDIILSATPGYDFRVKYEVPEHKGSHGSIHREHMMTPVATNAPLDRPVLRTVDVFSETMRLMERPLHA